MNLRRVTPKDDNNNPQASALDTVKSAFQWQRAIPRNGESKEKKHLYIEHVADTVKRIR